MTVGDNVLDVYQDLATGYPGGNAVNVAVAAVRAGIPSQYIGQVGDDAAGAHIVEALASEGVDVSRVRVAAGRTARVQVRTRAGERGFEDSCKGVVFFQLTADDYEAMARASVIHTSCYSGLDANLAAISKCAPLSYDFSDQPMEAIAPLLAHVTFAELSRGDLTWAHAAALAAEVAHYGPSTVLVTRGAADSVLLTDGQFHRGATTRAEHLVDTLGAGDAYIGRMLAGVATGEEVETILRGAGRAAREVISHYGGFGHALMLVGDEV